MGMKLTDADVLQLLPRFMRDDEAVQAFARAVNTLIQTPGGSVMHLREWDQIDNLSGEELDEMAWEMSLEWYDSTVDIENKRATLKAATLLKEKSGTKWAVTEAIKAAYGVDPQISEWFEYDGEPGHFRAKLEAKQNFDFRRILKAIEYVKRASAHLDEVELTTDERMELFFGCSLVIVKEFQTAMEKDDSLAFDWLSDEVGNSLTDESDNVLA